MAGEVKASAGGVPSSGSGRSVSIGIGVWGQQLQCAPAVEWRRGRAMLSRRQGRAWGRNGEGSSKGGRGHARSSNNYGLHASSDVEIGIFLFA